LIGATSRRCGGQHIFYEADRVARSDYLTHVPQEISIPCLHQPDLARRARPG
jgi:hypothetical protein